MKVKKTANILMFPPQNWVISAGVGHPCQFVGVWWREGRAVGWQLNIFGCYISLLFLLIFFSWALHMVLIFCASRKVKNRYVFGSQWSQKNLFFSSVFRPLFRFPIHHWQRFNRYKKRLRERETPKVFPVCLYLPSASVHCGAGEVVSAAWAMLATNTRDRLITALSDWGDPSIVPCVCVRMCARAHICISPLLVFVKSI